MRPAWRYQLERLSAPVAELQARLAQNCKNSSRPPSADGCQEAGAAAQARRAAGQAAGRAGRASAPVADPDAVVEHVPAGCGGCGDSLDDAAVVGVARRQVFDLPRVRAHVTEHRVQRRRCRWGHVTAGQFPPEATAPACYGSGIRAAIA